MINSISMKNGFILFFALTSSLFGQHILPLRERAKLIEEIQKERIEKLLPQLMQEEEIDLWVLITREYNEDPVVKPCCLPPGSMRAGEPY